MSRKKGNAGELNGFMDSGSRIVGELHFQDTYRIDGSLSGKVSSTGDLIVGRESEVDGEIRVRRLFVSGIVRGLVMAERVEIAPGARVEADVESPVLVVEEGAFFQGRCLMEDARSVNDHGEEQGALLGKERFVGRHDGQRVASQE